MMIGYFDEGKSKRVIAEEQQVMSINMKGFASFEGLQFLPGQRVRVIKIDKCDPNYERNCRYIGIEGLIIDRPNYDGFIAVRLPLIDARDGFLPEELELIE